MLLMSRLDRLVIPVKTFGTDSYFTSSASSRSKSILRREEQSQVGLKLDDRKNLKMPTCLILLIDKNVKISLNMLFNSDSFEISRSRSGRPSFFEVVLLEKFNPKSKIEK